MALEVFKYPLPTQYLIEIDMPKGAKILSFRNQGEVPTIWALVDQDNNFPDSQKVGTFRLAGTGDPIDQNINELDYIGTALFLGDSLVFHLFEVLEVD